MYSVWRNQTRLGVLSHVQDIAGKSDSPSGFGGVLLPDDATLTWKSMSQTRMVFLPHAPIFQHFDGTAPDDAVCYKTMADGRRVASAPLRAMPNDAPGVSAEAVIEIRRHEIEVVPSNMISVFCTDVDASAEAVRALTTQGLPSGLRQMIYVSVIHAATWPPPEFLKDIRVLENAT